MIGIGSAEGAKMFKVNIPLIARAALLFLVGSFASGCGPRLLPERPPEDYKGLVVEGPILGMEDYWIYQKPDGTRTKRGAGNLLYHVEFPLWVGRAWRLPSTASLLGQPPGTRSIPVEIECFAAAYDSITVKAGKFAAFECRCECMIAGATGGYDPYCGKWTFWYAPRAKNIVAVIAESTAASAELIEYKISEHSITPGKPLSGPDRKSAVIYNNRGNTYSNKGDFDRAIEDYTEAIQLNPKYDIAFYNRGLAYSNKGDHDRAIKDYSEAIRINPNYDKAFNNRGLIHSRKGAHDRAIEDYTAALRINPNYALALNNRGNAFRRKGDYDRAIQDYNEAIRINPDYDKAFYNRGIAYGRKGNHDRAIVDYNEAIRINPKYASAFNNRGNAHRRKGNNDRAIQDYDEAIRINPQNYRAFSNRGNAHKHRQNYERAIEDYDQAIRLNPRYASAFRGRGIAKFFQERLDAAVSDFSKAAEFQPANHYNVLWLFLAEARAGHNALAKLQTRSPRLDLDNWPGPIMNFYLGTIDESALNAAAQSSDPMTAREQVCEANFYTAEVKLIHNAVAEALPLLRAAVRECPPNFIEFQAATAELKRLGN